MDKKKEKSSNVTIVDRTPRVNVEYQLLVAERDDLLEAEIGYKRRIDKLEEEASETLKSFDVLYNENKILRSKLDTPEGVGVDSVESYNAVYKDREHMREANRAFKRRIRQLEDDNEQSQEKYNKLYQNHQLVTQKAQLETEFATRARDEKIVDMEKEQDEMTDKLKMFLKEREQYEYRISEMDKERNELQNKYDMLADQKHELQLRCDVLHEDREKMRNKIKDLEDQVPDPELKAKEEQQYLNLQAQVVALQVANTDASKEIHTLKEEIRALNKLKKEKVEMIDRALSVIVTEDAEENERIRREQFDEIVQELDERKKRSIVMLKENDKLKTENAELESKVANQDLEISELRKELEIRKSELEEMAVTVRGGENLNEEYLAMQDKLKDANASIHALENELVQEKKMAKLKNMELNKDLDQTKDNFNMVDKQRIKLESDMQTIVNENSTMQKVTEAQALELRNMKAQLEQVHSLFEDKTEKYEQMKKTEKESLKEVRETRIKHHVLQHELDNLKMEKAGHFESLKTEMEEARDNRKQESEQMKRETVRLREEVKKLKDYEYKITTMDSEIRRLMNRLRMTERMKKLPKKATKGDSDTDEMKDIKRKQKELERERNQLLTEKKQWEVMRTKYQELQMNNRRLTEENKRVRGDLDGSSFKVDTLEKRFQKLNVKSGDVEEPNKIQRAQYIDKKDNKEHRVHNKNKSDVNSKKLPELASKSPTMKTITEEVPDQKVGLVAKRSVKLVARAGRRKFERKTTRTTSSIDMSSLRSKKPRLPEVNTTANVGLTYGMGYKEIHGKRHRQDNKLELL